MALPSSGPLSGSQIAAELSVSSTNISLGGMSDSASFLAPDKYSDFYGYSAGTINSGNRTSGTYKKPAFGCSQTTATTFYWTKPNGGASNAAQVGDTCYTNSTATTTLGAGNYGQGVFSATQVITVNSSGVVTALYLCFN
jgi:hypothetical protein